MARLLNWLKRQMDLIKFHVKYPDVLIIKPLSIGTYYSQEGQDLYLSALLFDSARDSPGGYVVDVGCNHPERFSNSFFFEKFFDCKTIAIDPIEEYGALWKSIRPNATFIATALGNESCTVTLNIPEGNAVYDDMFSTVGAVNAKAGAIEYSQRNVPCVALSSLLDEHQVDEVLLVSIDVEGFELSVLEGIDYEHVLIKCFVIENNTHELLGSDDIRCFLKSKGYIYISRIGYYDDVFLHHSLVA